MKSVIGLLLGFAVEAACRWFDIPVPSPPKLLGALLVVATTVGYMTADSFIARGAAHKAAAATADRISGGATGPTPAGR